MTITVTEIRNGRMTETTWTSEADFVAYVRASFPRSDDADAIATADEAAAYLDEARNQRTYVA